MKVVVKVIRHPFKARLFQELAGVAICERADFALLITPHKLSGKMRAVQQRLSNVRVEVIDGKMLAALIRAQESKIGKNSTVDDAYFEALEMYSERVLDFHRDNPV